MSLRSYGYFIDLSLILNSGDRPWTTSHIEMIKKSFACLQSLA